MRGLSEASTPTYRWSMTTVWQEWTADDAAGWVAAPAAGDDKYSRGVLGVVTGSQEFPGAAVLGVEAAHRTGVGMVRYIGPRSVRQAVLARRPETVAVAGRVQAWLIGSGIDQSRRSFVLLGDLGHALAAQVPVGARRRRARPRRHAHRAHRDHAACRRARRPPHREGGARDRRGDARRARRMGRAGRGANSASRCC